MKKAMSVKAQQGIALIVVMIIMVIMLIGAIGILRNTNVGLGIAGNLGFKQNATSVSDQGVETARAWLMAQAQTTLYAAATGYVEKMESTPPAPPFDPHNIDTWPSFVISTADDGTSNEVRYVIHRMCKLPGSPSYPGQECVHPTANEDGSRQLNGAGVSVEPPPTPLYRVTVRTDGPRNTMSHIQVMIY